MTLIAIFTVLLIASLIGLVIKKAPFFDEPYKSWALWFLLVITLVILARGMLGGGGDILNVRIGR